MPAKCYNCGKKVSIHSKHRCLKRDLEVVEAFSYWKKKGRELRELYSTRKNWKIKRREEMILSGTPSEVKLNDVFHRLNWKFKRQRILYGYIADFYWHKYKVIVEVDGGIHQKQREYDSRRDWHLMKEGFRIVRVTNYEVNHELPFVIIKIENALKIMGY